MLIQPRSASHNNEDIIKPSSTFEIEEESPYQLLQDDPESQALI